MVAHYDDETLVVFATEQERSIAEQVDLDSLTRVVLTHLHFDHAGGLALVPEGVPIVIQRAEWEAGHDDAGIELNFFQPRDYADQGREVVLVDGDHDLLGDGSVELLSTPGHSTGHQSVRVGEIVIGADVAHFADVFDDPRFPAFAADFDAQRRSAERLRGLREEGLTVLPGHDPEVLHPAGRIKRSADSRPRTREGGREIPGDHVRARPGAEEAAPYSELGQGLFELEDRGEEVAVLLDPLQHRRRPRRRARRRRRSRRRARPPPS